MRSWDLPEMTTLSASKISRGGIYEELEMSSIFLDVTSGKPRYSVSEQGEDYRGDAMLSTNDSRPNVASLLASRSILGRTAVITKDNETWVGSAQGYSDVSLSYDNVMYKDAMDDMRVFRFNFQYSHQEQSQTQ
jgi:hypothetical protein